MSPIRRGEPGIEFAIIRHHGTRPGSDYVVHTVNVVEVTGISCSRQVCNSNVHTLWRVEKVFDV